MKLTEQIKRFAELECCYSQYFNASLAPVMDQVRKELSEKQAEELREYSNSVPGILSMAVSGPTGMPVVSPYEVVSRTGKWNSLKTEDYVAMCQTRIGESPKITSDLKLIADEWRTELVQAVGRERYDAMSKEMGTDVAYAYTGYQMERLMIDRLVRQQMPKSSLEYVMSSAAENSLLGLNTQLQRSALERQIAEKGEKAYSPSLAEKVVGKAVGFGADTVVTGGFSSWASLGRLALFETATEGVMAVGSAFQKGKENPSVEQLISKGVFGTDENILETFRKEATHIVPHENSYIRDMNEQMEGRLRLLSEDTVKRLEGWMQWKPVFPLAVEPAPKKEYANVPLVVLPGKEEEYLAFQKEKEIQERNKPKVVDNQPADAVMIDEQQSVSRQAPGSSAPASSGWGNLLSGIGLSDVGSVGRNMGYVISMLPDMLVGLFTGKTQSPKLKDNLFPIASILLGLFSKNPLIKMLLVGFGGMNLLNKAGHEALQKATPANTEAVGAAQREFKSYPDESLNTRIDHPEVKGDYLLATVDRVPCSIHLPATTVAAYQAGKLPLNTLANAVLAKSDEMRAVAQENYAASEGRTVHSRGIN